MLLLIGEKNVTENMTVKERWLATIHMKPVDRLPFWPKLDGAYPKAQETPFGDMSNDCIHDWIGSDQHKQIAGCVREVRKRTTVTTIRNADTMRTVFRSPHGELQLVKKFDEPSHAWHPTEFPVKTLDDIKIMIDVFEDVEVVLDKDQLALAKEQYRDIGEQAITTNGIGESPLMYWVEWMAGVGNAHFLLADYPQEVETLFEAMHSVLIANTKLICEWVKQYPTRM